MATIELSEKDAAVWQQILKGRERDKVHHHARKEQIRIYDQQYRERPERIEKDKLLHAQRLKENPLIGAKRISSYLEQVEGFSGPFGEWVTGFFEGDGSFYYYGGAVSFAQKEPQILEYIKSVVGSGTLTWNGQCWLLLLYQESAARLVKTFREYVACPHRLVQLRHFCAAELHEPTKDWFVGFWDAKVRLLLLLHLVLHFILALRRKIVRC